MNGPNRFGLVMSNELAVLRCGPEPPGELSVRSPQSIHPTVSAAKDGQASCNSRRGVYSCSCCIGPQCFAGIGVQSINGMRIYRGYKDSAVSDHRLG